ncbi:microbial collagenase [Saccharopolyspora erythraea NRRL 2338]|uniref:collagenase n=1 Tax=Saccharopolyspora erythraea TaxID=1836 RepID=UPI00038D133E|nr:collagenase [Saccharopolyspora erythraea]EQD85199.1 protease [Saccharopolyspora erythraea D]PFG96087.1 microbial collagenase [Saccharopolyspora erythraea NRRL 2338]
MSALVTATAAPASVTAAPQAAIDPGPAVARTAPNRTWLPPEERPPRSADTAALRREHDDPVQSPPRPSTHAADEPMACDPANFTGNTGAELVRQIRAVPTECINTLFRLTGSDAHGAFREEQMVTVANAYRDNALGYPGDNSTATAQLVLYLRAGYYAQWNRPDVVGEYGPALKSAIQGALDAFFANPRSGTVSDANGEVLAESVTLIDSSQENARYLAVVQRLLSDYNSSYDQYWWMVNAVNNVYTVLFRGHQLPEFVDAVQADPAVLAVLRGFALEHLDLLGTERAYLTSNAGRELARFLQHEAMRPTVRPMVRELLGRSEMTGPTAALWVGVAEMTDAHDRENCAEYGTCDLQRRLADAVLTVRHTCSPSIAVRAQQMTAGELEATCTSLIGQDAFFHDKVQDGGRPVADDNNTTVEVVAFDSSADYQTYAGAVFGIDTNNGGMYLEGDPAAPGNQPRFIAYEAEWQRPQFAIWNLNHEYTHYLDGRFDMYGDFAESTSTPTVWWLEGIGEYISYSYRDLPYQEAIEEAGRHTYPLSELWNTTYDADTARVYRWGYLAVRYMAERHPAELASVLGHHRTGDWQAARDLLTRTIGTSFDQDWHTWLDQCAAGACARP